MGATNLPVNGQIVGAQYRLERLWSLDGAFLVFNTINATARRNKVEGYSVYEPVRIDAMLPANKPKINPFLNIPITLTALPPNIPAPINNLTFDPLPFNGSFPLGGPLKTPFDLNTLSDWTIDITDAVFTVVASKELEIQNARLVVKIFNETADAEPEEEQQVVVVDPNGAAGVDDEAVAAQV